MITVIDTSKWDGVIRWGEVDASGLVSGAIHKCTEGVSYTDPQYGNNRAGTIATNIPWSAYHFYRPGYPALDQAKWLIKQAGSGVKVLWDDVETSMASALGIAKDAPAEEWISRVAEVNTKFKDAAGMEVDGQDIQAMLAASYLAGGTILTDTLTILDYWVSGGYYTAGIYSSPGFVKAFLSGVGSEKLARYLLWIANTEVTAPYIPAPWSQYGAWPNNPKVPLWQYAWDGSIPGIDAAVDMNYYRGTAAELASLFANGAAPTPPPEPDIPDVVRVTADKLNVRSGPGIAFPIIGYVPKGMTLFVTDKKTFSPSNYWYEIGACWVAGWWCEVV